MNEVNVLPESDLVMEFVETLHGLRRFKGWYHGHPCLLQGYGASHVFASSHGRIQIQHRS